MFANKCKIRLWHWLLLWQTTKELSMRQRIDIIKVGQEWHTQKTSSVTRFGKICPLWQNLKALGNFEMVNFVVGKFLNLLWQFLRYWANFYSCEWPNIEQIFWPFGHTDETSYTDKKILPKLAQTSLHSNLIRLNSFRAFGILPWLKMFYNKLYCIDDFRSNEPNCRKV